MDLLYVLQERGAGNYKIGHGNPAARKAACQTGNSGDLEIALVSLGGEPLESFLHKVFKDRHIRGEWFHFESFELMRSEVTKWSHVFQDIQRANPGLKPSFLATLALRKAA